MVRAILAGKTQTRREVKPQPDYVNKLGVPFYPDRKGPVDYRLCPYGQPGDRLWVRETFAAQEVKGWTVASSKPNDAEAEQLARATHRFRAYRADQWEGDKAPEGMKWKPAIHMPRWASRLTLEIVAVRVERLQDITEEDALAEGVRRVTKDNEVFKYCVYDLGDDMSSTPWAVMRSTAVGAYAELWESIHGAGSWQLNPWVWVLEFKRVN
jgi:hypothetical protein